MTWDTACLTLLAITTLLGLLFTARAPGRWRTGLAAVLLGGVISTFGTGLAAIVPYLNLALGVAMLVLAVRTFSGHTVTLRLPGLRAPEGQRLSEFYPFGIAYGLVSLGCTLPIFLIVVSTAATRPPIERFGLFALYGLGMGLIAVSAASALGKGAILRMLRYPKRCTKSLPRAVTLRREPSSAQTTPPTSPCCTALAAGPAAAPGCPAVDRRSASGAAGCGWPRSSDPAGPGPAPPCRAGCGCGRT